jgi:hypothetical protein
MKSFRLAIVIAVVIFGLCRVSAAQNVYGSTTINIDLSSGTVTATCETDFDGALDGSYQAEVVCTVTDQNGTVVAHGDNADIDGVGSTQVVLTFSGTPGSTYTATSIHHSIAVLVEQQQLKTLYEDPFNLSNAYQSEASEDYPNYNDWFGPGPEQLTHIVSIREGETFAIVNYPQIPTSLSAPTFQPVTKVVNGTVVDYFGNILRTGYCGVYQNNAADLLDQKGAKIVTTTNFTLTESFSNYTSTYGGTNLPTQSSTQNTSIQRLADTQAFGGSYPNNCPGPNDNESYDQSFTVTMGQTTYTLTTVRHISRGSFNGTETITETTKVN